ncbi:pancreatic triacylglycerol lipase-like [Nilaparvata lugens]|uniref:pancreatic triacylglycerol lipase-like n=1 Tax=Nilaparvata lugens TaxID=108931 RepID=UPI000B98369B|nr:pancreatic triacylglycerol lipase-like [Nilaparvata lugens]
MTRPNLEIDSSFFDWDKWVVFVTHGFFGSAVLNNWIGEMEEALLIRGDVTVIACDWSPGSRTINYAQAAANARVVGAEIARVAQFLLDNSLAARERIHLIGQSLGAHAMSYAAVNLKSVAHLTGLDPAQPGFEGTHPDVRIDPTDADFVDVIHTDARPFLPDLGLGLIEPAGDVDFFVNGGVQQPGCFQTIMEHLHHYPSVLSILTAPFQVVGDYFSCNHRRAHQYYIEALKTDCSFWARKWTPFRPLPELNPCTPDECQEMGKYTSLLPGRGTFYVQTKFPAPYCVWEQESDDNMIEYLLENNIHFFSTSASYPTRQQSSHIDRSNIQ